MTKKIKLILANILLIPVLTLALAGAVSTGVSAADPDQICDPDNYSMSEGIDCTQGNDQSDKLFGTGGIFTTITNTFLYVLGAVSVIMLIYGGIRYTISGGDSAQVTAAKNTIMYAIVGVVVALLAYAIVNFVISAIVK